MVCARLTSRVSCSKRATVSMGRTANFNTLLHLPGAVVPRRLVGRVGRKGNRGSDVSPGPGPLRRLPRWVPLWGVRPVPGACKVSPRPLSVRWRRLKGPRGDPTLLAVPGNVPAGSVTGRAALLLLPLALFLVCSPKRTLLPRNSGIAFTGDLGSLRTLVVSSKDVRSVSTCRGSRVNAICAPSLDERPCPPRFPRRVPWGAMVDQRKMCLLRRNVCGVISRLLSLL